MKLEPLAAAVEKISAKTPIGSALRSADWARMPLALRERAQLAARVESARVLAAIQDKLQKRIGLIREQVVRGDAGVDRSSFIGDLRQIAQEEGLGDGSGRITDISGRARLGLIFDFQTQAAAEYARYVAGQDRDMLDAFPAQELLRVEERALKREWGQRWSAAGGQFYGGRMIALKTDPVWTAISRFGTPYPPYDFGSGMGVEDVSRDEAEALGVIPSGARVEPNIEDFNAKLEASVPPDMLPELKKVFGDQVQIDPRSGKVRWQGNMIQDLYKRAVTEKQYKAALDLGGATSTAVKKAAPYMDISKHHLKLTADDIRKINKDHGAGETNTKQKPVGSIDFEMLPHIWRDPDEVTQWTNIQKRAGGKAPYTLEFKKKILGKQWVVLWQRTPGNILFPNTMYIENA